MRALLLILQNFIPGESVGLNSVREADLVGPVPRYKNVARYNTVSRIRVTYHAYTHTSQTTSTSTPTVHHTKAGKKNQKVTYSMHTKFRNSVLQCIHRVGLLTVLSTLNSIPSFTKHPSQPDPAQFITLPHPRQNLTQTCQVIGRKK